MNEIKFCNPNKLFGFLNNDAEHGFMARGVWWRTATHYYESYKFKEKKYKDLIQGSTHVRVAKIRGRFKHWPLKENWNQIKDQAMYEVLRTKFLYKENNGLKKALLNTEGKKLIAALPDDFYWGTGDDNSGQNKLGLMLEKLREELKKEKLELKGLYAV